MGMVAEQCCSAQLAVPCHKECVQMQVRLKLLPLLLEWDVRQGPQPSSSSGVQFVPTSIRKVSTRGADDMKGDSVT